MKKKTKEESIEARLIRSMDQALTIAKGRARPAKAYGLPLTAKSASATPGPRLDKGQITRIREGMNLSQQVFADALNVSLGTVRSWEQGARIPDGPSVRLLEVAQKYPATILRTLVVREGGDERHWQSGKGRSGTRRRVFGGRAAAAKGRKSRTVKAAVRARGKK